MADNTTTTKKHSDPWTDLNLDDSALQNLLDKPLEEQDTTRLRDGEQHDGFDNNVGDTWIYPTNLTCRAYQLSIVQAALYHNTLVVLPTGLGKTFIAAVVMYNMYRWYPRGKVIFMAPTRPLVNQQIEACQKIMPFPRKDTVELTGKLPRSKRTELWKTKRVFFATPQVVQSDIFGGPVQEIAEETDDPSFDGSINAKSDFPFDLVKLIVIDEAHKAKGKYAYSEVAQAIAQKNKYFRVLALSATPGRTMEDVAEVCRNLFISHLEVRWDTSIDVLPYVHKRSMKTIVVELGDKIKDIREQLLQIVDPYLRQLIESEMLSGSLTNINRNFLLYEQKRFRDRSFHNGRHPQHSAITTNFAICISLYHALELLERHGLRVFLNNFEEDEDGKGKFVLQMDRRLKQLVDNLKEHLGPNPFEVSAGPMTNGQIAEIPKNLDFGHPKFEKARECLVEHFQNNEDTRAIVFCEYRESVMLIYRMLLQHVPILKPRCFVGQGGTSGSLRALTQKQQIQIMNDFRSGKSNILIATSIGEEGIDVGEVDLIVCFDISTSNPTRFVQRIGRTGRKKNGHVVMLVTEGREQQLLKEVMANKDQINKKLFKSVAVQQALYKHAPRMVPTEFKPKCLQTFIKPSSDDEEEEAGKSKKSSKTLAIKIKPVEKGTQDLRKFFNTKPKELDKEDLDFFEIDTKMTQARPGLQTQQKMEKSFDKIKNLFKDLRSPLATQTQKPGIIKTNAEIAATSSSSRRPKLNNSQGSIKDFFIDLNDSYEEVKNTPCKENEPTKPLDPDPEHVKRLNKFLKTSFITPEVLKRAEIRDIGYHLKSKEMSNDMKAMMLMAKPEYIKENLEQMNVIKVLHDSESNDISPEEKSIKEIYTIILELFGGLEKVEKLLQDYETLKFKQKCQQNYSGGSSDEEEVAEDEQKFKLKLDKMFEGLGDGKRHDNFEWIQERVKQTGYYKDLLKTKTEPKPEPEPEVTITNMQQSMVYDTFNEQDEETSINDCDNDYSMTESKYCSQWMEFNKPDLDFKSTPVAQHKSFKRPEQLKKTSTLLTKLTETIEEYDDDEDDEEPEAEAILKAAEEAEKLHGNISTDSKQIQGILQMLGKKLNDSSLRDSQDELETTSENIEKNLKNNNSTKNPQKSSLDIKKSLQSFDNFLIEDDEDALFQAAAEAEMKFSQNKTNDSKIDKSNSREDPNKTPDIINIENYQIENPHQTPFQIKAPIETTVAKLTPPSLNSTPDFIEIAPSKSKMSLPALPTPPDISIQQELDIDMEAFMEPFPEEQDLIRKSQQSSTLSIAPLRRESLKENLNKDFFTRQSPDLFAEEFIKSPIKPQCTRKQPTLASKLSTKINIQKSLNPPTSLPHKSPQKPLFNQPNPSKLLQSPSSRQPTDKQKYEKSPSLFDMYLKSTKGKGKLPKAVTNSSSFSSSLHHQSRITNDSSRNSPVLPALSQPNESLIVIRKRSGTASKRKIFDSDSDDDIHNSNDVSVIGEDDDSDFEEIAATQGHNESSILKQRRKRMRFNSFIEQEAGVSGSENSEDEAEHTIGHYVHDSVVVPSDDEDPDQASTSHMQAMYLQSLKSPQQRRGAFKIPPPRVYNDHSRIFSQAVLPEEAYSQYMPDSFVADEEDSFINDRGNATEVSMCPLEKAEKILKERRRAKKLGLVYVSPVKTKPKLKRRIHLIEESSSDEYE